MTKPRAIDPDLLDRLLSRAEAALPAATARFDALVAAIADQLPDPRRAREVGVLLEQIARGKLYRLGGHATLADFTSDALGISRTTVYRLRRIARAAERAPIHKQGKMRAYEAARAAETGKRARGQRGGPRRHAALDDVRKKGRGP